jgi:hypothetical protein
MPPKVPAALESLVSASEVWEVGTSGLRIPASRPPGAVRMGGATRPLSDSLGNSDNGQTPLHAPALFVPRQVHARSRLRHGW